MSDGDGEFCSREGEGDGFLQYAFDDLTCVTGYALQGPKNLSDRGVPGSWTLQGSVDGSAWKYASAPSCYGFYCCSQAFADAIEVAGW